MQDAAFDDFYRQTRHDLLLQTFLVHGDLTAATRGTREAYVVAWHHWKKVGPLADPAEWVRPLALRLVQRRSAGRIWHRTSQLPAEARAPVEALSSLGLTDRRLVVLVHVAGLSLPAAAREVALTKDAAERRLRDAETRVSRALETTVHGLSGRLGAARVATDPVVLPRTPMVLRLGRRRRHLQTAGIVAGVLALTLAAGTVAQQDEQEAPAVAATPAQPTPSDVEPEPTLGDTLLDRTGISRVAPGVRLRAVSTTDNTTGPGRNMICQQERFADPEGVSTLVRTFEAGNRPVAAVQTTEVSRTVRQARRAMSTVAGWFGDCTEERVHLVSANRVSGVGDEAMLLTLLAPDSATPWQVVGMARTGATTTTLIVRAAGPGTVRLQGVRDVLGRAVSALCRFQEPDGPCRARPRHSPMPPPPAGDSPGLLAVVDLPPLPGLSSPWIGTDPRPGKRENLASTTCDNTTFRGAARARSRTFLMPEARVPLRFGVDETYGVFRNAQGARRFVDTIESRLAGCSDRDVTTTVSATARAPESPTYEMVAWHLATEINENETVRFRMGVVRVGARVAQVKFVPSDRHDLGADRMRALLVRAGQRLRELG